MIELRDDNGILCCYSSETFAEAKSEARLAITAYEYAFSFFIANDGYKRLLNKWHEVMRSSQISLTILDAHGYVERPGWQYEDNGKEFPIQGWLDKHDGTATALIIGACRPPWGEISSQRSLVFHGEGDVSPFDVANDRKIARAYVPGVGYIGNSRREINDVIKNLR